MTPEEARIDRVPKEQLFFITFGQRYRTETHPAGDWITPNGYVAILADSEPDARDKANEAFGNQGWAFIYDHLDVESGRFDRSKHYPDGVLAVYFAEKRQS